MDGIKGGRKEKEEGETREKEGRKMYELMDVFSETRSRALLPRTGSEESSSGGRMTLAPEETAQPDFSSWRCFLQSS